MSRQSHFFLTIQFYQHRLVGFPTKPPKNPRTENYALTASPVIPPKGNDSKP